MRYEIEAVECDICMDLKLKPEMCSLDCGHKFCSECVRAHIENAITNGSVPIRCPEAGCGMEIKDEYVEGCIEEEMHKKYVKFMKRYQISLIEGAVYCPYPNCESYAVKPMDDNCNDNTTRKESIEVEGSDKDKEKEKKQQIILSCIENDHLFCMNCRQPPHKGRPCDVNEEVGWKFYKKANDLRKCPKCGIEIAKDSGCNHMTCTKCSYQFCWICGWKYSPNHYENPLSPCFGMQYTSQYNVLVRNSPLRVLKTIGIILAFLVGLPIALAIPSFVGMGVGIYFFFSDFSYDLTCFAKVLYFIVLIFLAVAYLSFGYLLIVSAIIASPLGLYYYISSSYLDER